jgi:hypothetical protein
MKKPASVAQKFTYVRFFFGGHRRRWPESAEMVSVPSRAEAIRASTAGTVG